MNEKVAINTVNATKETSNLSPINSNSILRTSSLTERKSTMANQFNSKFAQDSTHNSSCLTADGCFSRHDISRRKMNILQLKRIIELIYVHSLDLIIKKAD